MPNPRPSKEALAAVEFLTTEGRVCVLKENEWVIVDRYGKVVEGEPHHVDYRKALLRCTVLNQEIQEKVRKLLNQ